MLCVFSQGAFRCRFLIMVKKGSHNARKDGPIPNSIPDSIPDSIADSVPGPIPDSITDSISDSTSDSTVCVCVCVCVWVGMEGWRDGRRVEGGRREGMSKEGRRKEGARMEERQRRRYIVFLLSGNPHAVVRNQAWRSFSPHVLVPSAFA